MSLYFIIKRFIENRKRKDRSQHALLFRERYARFRDLLDSNAELSKIMADVEEKLEGRKIFGQSYIKSQFSRAVFHSFRMVASLEELSVKKYPLLKDKLNGIQDSIKGELERKKTLHSDQFVLPFNAIDSGMLDFVGGKSANLGELKSRTLMPVPDGFAITAHAYDLFLEANDLKDEIAKQIMSLDPDDTQSIIEISEEIQKKIIMAHVPTEIESAITQAYERHISPEPGNPEPLVSMRSSAVGEDGELSFAGQYLTSFNVAPGKIVTNYKYVVASLFTPRAMMYRLSKGISDENITMCVACVKMVNARSSGVIYTANPNTGADEIMVTGVFGLGTYAVDGRVIPDTFTFSKSAGLKRTRTAISCKKVMMASYPDGRLIEEELAEDRREIPSLSDAEAENLAGLALRIERHYGCPQDIEFAIDGQDRIFILQARPLHKSEIGINSGIRQPIPPGYTPLIEGGCAAYPGVSEGIAFTVEKEDDLSLFPDGGVLVAKHSSPAYALVMRKCAGIITDSGSVTGHMASVAREFKVPSILGLKDATRRIPTGTHITVDSINCRVYVGEVPELAALKDNDPTGIMLDTPVYNTLRKLAEYLTPLNLINPGSPDFSSRGCKTIHDVMRFVHERSYTAMFTISDMVSDDGGSAYKLNAGIPLDLYVIDLGGGLENVSEKARSIEVGNVVSHPFKALLAGACMPELSHRNPRPIHLKGLFSVMGEQMIAPPSLGSERFGDKSYAIISDKYLNFSSRVGYHYSVLDSYCGRTVNKNYITFSFKGGAADEVRRNRRVRSISLILTSLGFKVDVQADRVDARFQKYEREEIESRLNQIGRLLMFTRQMDMLMHGEESVQFLADCFINGNYKLEQDNGGISCKPANGTN